MTPQEIKAEVARFPFWYHKIDLGHGIITPGLDFDLVWENIRNVRSHLDLSGRNVLDIGSFDGMWAFEAEQLGAGTVVATDCYYDTYERFLFCKQVLESRVYPYYNVSPYRLTERLDVFLEENWKDEKPFERLFDIVQHLGVLYHLRDPLLSLSQARSVMRPGGHLIIETGAVLDDQKSYMLFNGGPPDPKRVYQDTTTWWAPTIKCLNEMLEASLFKPLPQTMKIGPRQPNGEGLVIGRVCLIAEALPEESVDKEYVRELKRTYRNPGLILPPY